MARVCPRPTICCTVARLSGYSRLLGLVAISLSGSYACTHTASSSDALVPVPAGSAAPQPTLPVTAQSILVRGWDITRPGTRGKARHKTAMISRIRTTTHFSLSLHCHIYSLGTYHRGDPPLLSAKLLLADDQRTWKPASQLGPLWHRLRLATLCQLCSAYQSARHQQDGAESAGAVATGILSSAGKPSLATGGLLPSTSGPHRACSAPGCAGATRR